MRLSGRLMLALFCCVAAISTVFAVYQAETEMPVWRHALTGMAQTLLIVAITLLIVRWSLGRPLRHMAQWLRDLRTGNASAGGKPPEEFKAAIDKRLAAALI